MAAAQPGAPPPAPVAAEPTSRRNLLPWLGVPVALLLGVGGGFLGRGLVSHEEAPEAAASASDKPAAVGAPATEGAAAAAPGIPLAHGQGRAVTTLGTFTVNLRGSAGGRVLRMQIYVESASESASLVEANRSALKDAANTLASDYTYPDLEGLDGKTHVRDELLARLNALVGKQALDGLYFTEFVVQ